jgi:CDP-glucose 4,6-dehydratase
VTARPPIDPAFWRARRVFVTGHTGFKGSWLCHWLLGMGTQVGGFAIDVPTTPALFDDLGLAARLDDCRGDVRDLAALRDAMAAFRPDTVIHLAAQPLVRLSYAQPVETYAVNVLGTAHLLESVRAQPQVRVAAIVTSDKCYENREWLWPYRENDAMGGHDPYSSSKGCAELVTAAYQRSFFADPAGPRVISLRAGNVLGGGDWAADRLVPDLVRGIQSDETVPIRHPHAVRPWQHVLEPLSGYLRAIEHAWDQPVANGQSWNFGPDPAGEQPVGWIAAHVAGLWPAPGCWRDASSGQHPHEAQTLRLDSTKARCSLGWEPRLSLTDALDMTVAWYRARAAGADLRDLTDAQIGRYCGAA